MPAVGAAFCLAVTTLLYREFAIIVAGLLVAILTSGQPNQIGALTFLILLVMRLSAELNLFLGVRYLPEAFLPEGLAYLKSYFRVRRFNLLFPVSILGSSVAAISLARRAMGAEGAEAVGFALLFVLMALAILETFFPDDASARCRFVALGQAYDHAKVRREVRAMRCGPEQGTKGVLTMDYDRFFASELDALRQEGRYPGLRRSGTAGWPFPEGHAP